MGKLRTAYAITASYLRGWRTRRRFVVLQSDDWGSIRTASRAAYDQLLAAGYALGKSPYSLDSLETDEDLLRLFEVLRSVRDAAGRPACMTGNMILANPDFEQVRRSGFREYAFEPAADTLARHPQCRQVVRLWNEGRREGLFIPQLHGREHVRWWDWIRNLSAGSAETRETFELGMCGVPFAASKEGIGFYAPIYVSAADLAAAGVDGAAMVRQAAELFQRQFGYVSLTTIAPNHYWMDQTERWWAATGVRYIQSEVFQRCLTGNRERWRQRFLGQRSPSGCMYLVRNCYFEPAFDGDGALGKCLRAVARAFFFHKPAIIGSHRANYIGSIDPDHRQRNLCLLRDLLTAIRRRWADVEFLSTPELGRIIEGADSASPALETAS